MKTRILDILWAIDCHSLQFLRENKDLFRNGMMRLIHHELLHGFINSFFGMNSKITLYVKTLKSQEAILTGGHIVVFKKSLFWICAEICHSFIDSLDRITHNKWYGFRQAWQDFFHNLLYPLSNYPVDSFRKNVSEYFTPQKIHFKYRFRIFEYEITRESHDDKDKNDSC